MELMEVIKDAAAVCAIIITFGGGGAVIVKLLDYFYKQKAFKAKCEGYETEIKEVNDKIERAHNFAQEALEQMQSETDAKLQQIRAEQEMLTYCMSAVLDGLHQLNCNGPVTEASKKLATYLNEQAHN